MASLHDLDAPTFGQALRGYDRNAVDDYVATAGRRIAELTAEIARLRAELERTEHALGDLDPGVVLDRARAEADRIVEHARVRAATIDERARQEYAWRRRKVRQDQDLVDLRKQQILHQIVSLSELAVKTAGTPLELDGLELSESELGELAQAAPAG